MFVINTDKEQRKHYCFSEWIQDAETHFPEPGSPAQNDVTFMGQAPCEVIRLNSLQEKEQQQNLNYC